MIDTTVKIKKTPLVVKNNYIGLIPSKAFTQCPASSLHHSGR